MNILSVLSFIKAIIIFGVISLIVDIVVAVIWCMVVHKKNKIKRG